MTRERFSTPRAQAAKAAKRRARRKQGLSPEIARRLARARRTAIGVIALGGCAVTAGIGLVATGHPAIAALPLIAGAFVIYRGERRLARADLAMRKAQYATAGGGWPMSLGAGGCGASGTGCAAGCVGGTGRGGRDED
jgi:hypothetical protein